MATQTIKFVALIILMSTFLQCCLSDRCNPEDKKVLLRIKKALNNPYVLISWDPKTGCCGWNSVECDEKTHRITSLDISNDDFSGKIPAEVGDLPYLDSLTFHKNPNLTGNIPRSVTKLKRLRFLRLDWNALSGQIPFFIGELKTLESFSISFNRFSGPIPASLGTLPNLRGLSLDRNRLTGPIPETFGNFAGRIDLYLYLSHNQLSGPIPESFKRNKKGFSLIDLSRNRLQGDASGLFGPEKGTGSVDISRNFFEFDISKVKFQKELFFLDINHNRIFGTLPPDLTKLSLQHFNVSYNRLCGKIPVGGRLQTRFGVTEYFHNSCLCGAPLPKCK